MGVPVRVRLPAPNIGRVEMEKMPAGLTLARKGYGSDVVLPNQYSGVSLIGKAVLC